MQTTLVYNFFSALACEHALCVSSSFPSSNKWACSQAISIQERATFLFEYPVFCISQVCVILVQMSCFEWQITFLLQVIFLLCFHFAANFPPIILGGPTEVNITVDETATITVTAEDPNNDSLTFTLSGTLPAGYTMTSDASSVTLAWMVTSNEVTFAIWLQIKFVFSF